MAHKFLPKAPTTKNGPEQFTGDVWVDPIAYPQEEGHGMIVARVRFAPGAHTAWHSHAKGQTLHVTSGVALFGMRDGTAVEVMPGESSYCPAGEEHWHGATPEDFMEHPAKLENAEDPAQSTRWLEHVAEGKYRRPSNGKNQTR
ncbi:cupin domain-containing protein [Arthrobacter sp. AQ5-05]|uniref:cupin domain-containing protein n=1 Tax=Arthrobacter sp. AQ5-05 TaxID=2184581 RepID=UPI002570F078|nr:cupin domain-containing protein [Arthrobacter sp. AQ5-05]